MIKILIIDDEIMIRTGIRTSIDWEAYGMAVVGEASNGEEGLQGALELNPDISIIDVRMPIMDGLAFAKAVKEKIPKMKIVIVSGYDDFKYAKEAVRLGVNEYLLKPIGADELINVAQKLCREISDERCEMDKEKTLRGIFSENLLYVQSRLIGAIIKKEYTDSAYIVDKMRELQMDLSSPALEVIIIDIDDFYLITENLSDLEKENLKVSVKLIADEVLNPLTGSGVYLSESDYLISVINIRNLNESEVRSRYAQIREDVRNSLNLTITIGVSNPCAGILNIPDAYGEALAALRSKVYKGKNKIIFVREVDRAQDSFPVIYPSEDEKEILDSLKTMKTDRINSVIEKICANLAVCVPDEKKVKDICLRLIIISASYLEEIGVDFRNHGGGDFAPYKEIEKYETISDIEVWLKSIFRNFIEAMQDSKNEKFRGLAKVAIKYISENYYKDLNVLQMAAVTYVTPNYFSRVFKRETGKSFTEWLNTVRIEMAKKFLQDKQLRVYEIAYKVGYNDYKIFHFNFKKYAGCTPKEYRNNV
jgi:Response regulator containing CheY-like receiver domain and AraC-type DNA-binding domain